jgi:hypothetical protein
VADNALKMPLSTTIGRHANQSAQNFAHPVAKGLPCRVTKVEKDIITVAFEGSNGVWNMPTRKIPQAFSPYGRDPTQVGDKGYASPSDYHLGGISGLGHVQSNWAPRGNLTPLSFHPISKVNSETRDYDQLTHAGGPKGVKIIQEAKQPKDDQAKPPNQPTPHLMRAMLGWGDAARRAWLRRPAPPPMVTPLAEDERSFMEVDKGGVITHHSKTGKHAVTVDEGGKKITLKVPVNDSNAWLGGTGKNSDLYGSVLVLTPSGMMPSVNVKAKWQKQDD